MTMYPLSRYEIDQHVDAGITNLSGTVDAIPHALAAIIWSIDRHIADALISIFEAAFNITLTTPTSPLFMQMARTGSQLYNSLVQPLFTTAIIILGLWSLWTLLVARNYANGISKICISLACSTVAMLITLSPAATIGQLSLASHDISKATLTSVLPTAHRGSVTSVTAGLRISLIHEPWILLNFGAARHCTDRANNEIVLKEAARIPLNVSCIRSSAIAPQFLANGTGSDKRNQAFDRLNDGTPTEKLAVRIQKGGAGYDRVAIALGVLVASIGAFILIGGLALGMIAAQLYALLLLACAPIALLAALIPGQGHYIFSVWIKQLVGSVFRGAVYCLYLTIAIAISLAVAHAGKSIGNVSVLALQAILWWGLVIYGRNLSRKLGEHAVARPAAHVASSVAHATRALPNITRQRSDAT